MKKPVLVVMAAGMGSRYGGLKQMDAVGGQGEAMLDYSLYDAWQAGFETAVIIIKEAIRKDFQEIVGKRLEKSPLKIRYAYQEIQKVPAGYAIPKDRIRPLGTGHAVLCAKEEVDSAPFVAINADDYYGKSAFRDIYQYLLTAQPGDDCMVGYRVGNTVTENGSVARGVCTVDPQGKLAAIQEKLRVEKYDGGIHYTDDGGESWTDLPADTVVSMNMWGFAPGFMEDLESQFPEFMDNELPENPLKAEFLLPKTVDTRIREGRGTVTVLRSEDKWYGVTYAADKPKVVEALSSMTQQGLYPDGLWK